MLEPKLYKIRSVSACMGCAYHLYAENFKMIFRRMWLPVTLTSLCMAVVMLLSLYQDAVALSAGGRFTSELMTSTSLLLGMVLVTLVPTFWAYGRFTGLMNDRPTGWNVRRLLKFYVTFVVICIILELAFIFAGRAAGSVLTGCLGIVVMLVAMIPLVYSAMKYLMEPGMPLSSLYGKAYVTGWRHWGFLFGLVFLAWLIMMVICVIVYLPLIGLSIAANANAYGMLGGDASGLPSTFEVLTFVVAACTYFIMFFLQMWMTFNFYYAYGSIEAREKGDDFESAAVGEPGDNVKRLEDVKQFEDVK